MRRDFGFIAAFLIALFLAVSAAAEPLRLATAALAPYGRAEGGAIAGLAHEVGTAILEAAGFEPVETLVPLADAVAVLTGGKADVFIAVPTPELEDHAENLGGVFPYETVVLGRLEQPLRTLQDVRGNILAAVGGTVVDERISKENGILLHPTHDFEHSLKMLMAHRVDFTVGPKLGLFYAAQQLRLPRKALGKPLSLSSGHFSLFAAKAVPGEILDRLREALHRLLDDGTISSIEENYYL